jgi:hypothetical protein
MMMTLIARLYDILQWLLQQQHNAAPLSVVSGGKIRRRKRG